MANRNKKNFKLKKASKIALLGCAIYLICITIFYICLYNYLNVAGKIILPIVYAVLFIIGWGWGVALAYYILQCLYYTLYLLSSHSRPLLCRSLAVDCSMVCLYFLYPLGFFLGRFAGVICPNFGGSAVYLFLGHHHFPFIYINSLSFKKVSINIQQFFDFFKKTRFFQSFLLGGRVLGVCV